MKKREVDFNYEIVPFILENGDIADILRVANAGLDISEKRVMDELARLKRLLNPDGGVPFALSEGNPSSVKETAELLALVMRYADRCAEIIGGMIPFLVSRQKKDGGFAETLNLEPLIQDRYASAGGVEWYPVGKSVTWLTGKALEALCRAGYDEEHRLRRARDFLIYLQNEDGHWPDFKGQNESDPLATGNIILGLKEVGVSRDHKACQDARAALFHHLKKSVESDSTYDMVDLSAIDTVSSDIEQEVVNKGIELVIKSQNKDGGWTDLGTKKSNPELTSLLVFALKTCCKDE
ncbi:hypothetical protein EU538_08905 [Candidatus Thorarchaeota archaeon]|nr:MAG: hypothetical protein EU538_08905 [Candidatus Thorarchaeota archaeon]